MDGRRTRELLKQDEGVRLKPYLDTRERLSIGVGRNLTNVGISHDEAMMLFEHDVADAEETAARYVPSYGQLSDVRQAVLISMAFNLGPVGFGHFRDTIAAIEAGDYALASSCMLDSVWAKQVKTRAVILSQMMATDQWSAKLKA